MTTSFIWIIPALHLNYKTTQLLESAKPESILDSEDLLQLDSISISSQATCNIETEFLPEFKGQLDDINLSPTDVSLGTMTMECSYCKRRLMHHMTISIIMALKSKIKMSSSLMPPSLATLLHDPNSWTNTIMKTRSPLTLHHSTNHLSSLL